MRIRILKTCTLGVPVGRGAVQRVDASVNDELDLPDDYARLIIKDGVAIDAKLAAEFDVIAAELEAEAKLKPKRDQAQVGSGQPQEIYTRL